MYITLIVLAGLGIVFGVALALVASRFVVKVDPKVEQVRETLPGANCGACGFAGCMGYAEAVVGNPDVASSMCAPGKAAVAEKIAVITGKKAEKVDPKIARVFCQGGASLSQRKFIYTGVQDCTAAVLAAGGDKSCDYGCLGYATCMRACPFDAITMSADNLPHHQPGKVHGLRKVRGGLSQAGDRTRPGFQGGRDQLPQQGQGHRRQEEVPGRLHRLRHLRQDLSGGCHQDRQQSRADRPQQVHRLRALRQEVSHQRDLRLYSRRGRRHYIDPAKCAGIDVCEKVCPVNAISGDVRSVHVVNQEKCIGCRMCESRCPKKAITMVEARRSRREEAGKGAGARRGLA